MIMSEHQQDVVQTGISFMRAITEAYGSDQGLELWDTIANTLDPDIKGQILFAMLTGDFTGGIRIVQLAAGADFITAIKTLRNVTGWSLKEAKEAIDGLRDRSARPIKIEVHSKDRARVVAELRSAGLLT